MSLSLNELESLSKRAVRGGGYPWGLAEEAGKAARWLCIHGLDAVGELAALLDKSLVKPAADYRPVCSDVSLVWRSHERLCPLATGAHLSDNAKKFMSRECELRNIVHPTLLLPFVANVAYINDQTYTVECNDSVATVNSNSVDLNHPFTAYAEIVYIKAGGFMSKVGTRQHRAYVNEACLLELKRFAELTYAPATEKSRLLGAGTVLSDND